MKHMKKTITFKILASLSYLLPTHAGSAQQEHKLVWADEFNGDSSTIRNGESKRKPWVEETTNCKPTFGTRRTYGVEGGNLVIEAHKDNPNMSGTTRLFIRPDQKQTPGRLDLLPWVDV